MNENRGQNLTERMKNLRMIRTSAVIRNPLLLEAVGLCPVVAIATSFKSALFLALVTAVELIICEVLASRFLKNVKRYIRVAIYFFVGMVIVYPIMYLVTRFVPSLSLEFGIFLPLMAVNSLLALHCERVAVKRTVKDSFLDAISVSVSYGAVAIIAGFLREILGSGTLGGAQLHLPVTFSAMLTPFGGLLILGFAAAVLKSYIYKKYPQSSPDRAFNTSEVRQSLKGSLRELMNDDFNPYDEGGEGSTSSFDADSLHKVRKTAEEKPKKEKSAVKIIKTNKKNKENLNNRLRKSQENKTVKREYGQERERTYLDDFSDMLSDLENYKNREQSNSEEGEGDE